MSPAQDSLQPPPSRGAYDDLLLGSRPIGSSEHTAREAFFEELAPDKRESMFELEVLLKGVACFSNPRNHPGVNRRTPVVAIDFREPLALMAGGIRRISHLARACLGERDRTFVFHRYLETVLPEDTARSRLVRRDLVQDSPEASLLGLRRSFTNLAEVTEALLRLNRLPFRLFYATASLAQREIAQNAYFNPLSGLEFRPEFDRITSPEVLEVIQRIPGDAQRLVALTFLSLFRMLRYVGLIDSIAREPSDAMSFVPARIYLLLAVLRSDVRALAQHLRRNSGVLLSSSFEKELLSTSATDIKARYDELQGLARQLVEVRGCFECLTGSLRLELRRVFEHDLPAPGSGATEAELRQAAIDAAGVLRPALQNGVLFVGRTLGARLEEVQVFDDEQSRRDISERLRQHVWMFHQIVRAFILKASHAGETEDRWTASSSLQFVREFLAYFRAMGYPLLRACDYPRFQAFVSAIRELNDADLLDPPKLHRALQECEAFHEFLLELFDQIGRREELIGRPFEKRTAAAALRLYLGD